MLMTVNIKLSIIVIAEIIPSTDDTCLHQSISPQNGPSKDYYAKVPNSTPANHQRESIASILPVVSTILQPYAEQEGIITKVYHRFNHRFRYMSISSC